MRQGSMDIAKLGDEPELYAVSFATPDSSTSIRAARTFTRLEDVDEFLQQAGIRSDRIQSALNETRRGGTASIPGVMFEDRDLQDLGLTPPSGEETA
jgi:hypothetical protein